MNIAEIRSAIDANQARVTRHANEEAGHDRLTFAEVFESVVAGEIIEDYPLDRPFPSCLIYGVSLRGEPIHSVWALTPSGESILITVYRPDPDLWIDNRQRKPK